MIAYKGTWYSGTTYNEGDLVKYDLDKCWYVCIKDDVRGTTRHPHNTLYWTRASQSVAEAAEIAYAAYFLVRSDVKNSIASERAGLMLGNSTTEAATAIKAVTGMHGNFTSGQIIGVSFRNANSAADPILKIDGGLEIPVDFGTHEASEMKNYCLFILGMMSGSNRLYARFIDGGYTKT